MSDIKTGYIECIYYEVFEFLNLLWPPQLVHPSLRVPIKSKPPRLNALHGCPLLVARARREQVHNQRLTYAARLLIPGYFHNPIIFRDDLLGADLSRGTLALSAAGLCNR